MKTKKKAVRRVTSVLPLEPMQVSSFYQQAESHGLHLQPKAIVSDLGRADLLLNLVSQSSCKASLSTDDLCVAANYREKNKHKRCKRRWYL